MPACLLKTLINHVTALFSRIYCIVCEQLWDYTVFFTVIVMWLLDAAYYVASNDTSLPS